MRTVLRAMVCVTGLAAAVGSAGAAEGWLRDVEAAKARAKEEGKDLLLDFTGSDWCVWCLKLDGEVFQADPFPRRVVETFVPVTLDFPRDANRVTPEEKARNEEWQERLGVRGFPTVVLADADGRPYARTGYREGGPEEYLRHLAELVEVRERRDAAFARAAEAEGIEAARALDEGLAEIPAAWWGEAYVPELRRIVALDADGEAGLARKYRGRIDSAARARTLEEIDALAAAREEARDWPGLVDEMRDVVRGSDDDPAVLHLAMLHMAVGYLEQERLEEGIVCLQEGLTLEPNGARADEMRRMLREARRQRDGE
ncbi:MAG: thioredoxin family protein [Planctomycetota bacterium JB042]